MSDHRSFWADFAARHWEQRTLVIPESPVALSLDDDAMFDLLVRAAASHGESDVAIRFYIDNTVACADVQALLPEPADVTLDGYFARLDRALAGRDYLLLINQIHTLEPDLWLQACGILEPLYRALGELPGEYVDVDVIAGRYRTTAFGVHRDPASTFMFPTYGQKQLLTWPPDYDSVEPRTTDYSSLRADATVLEGVPGSLVYWPSSAWHVGESPGGPSVSLQLTLYLKGDPIWLVLDEVANLIAPGCTDRTAATYPLGDADGGAPPIPSQIRVARDALMGGIGSGELDRRLTELWLKYVSAYGFAALPEPLATSASDPPPRVRLRAGVRVFTLDEASEGELTVISNGYSARVPNTRDVLDAIAALRAGARVEARGGDDDIGGLLRQLHAWRALTDAEAPSAAEESPRMRATPVGRR